MKNVQTTPEDGAGPSTCGMDGEPDAEDWNELNADLPMLDISETETVADVQEEVREEVDKETEHWPVLPPFRDEFNDIKFKYCAVPLPIYIHNRSVRTCRRQRVYSGCACRITFQISTPLSRRKHRVVLTLLSNKPLSFAPRQATRGRTSVMGLSA